jgi:uncharacterized protein YggE
LIALGMVGSAYLLSTVDYSPKVNVSDITSTPNIYVSSNPPDHVLSVSGTASEMVAPDLVTIQLSIETEAVNAKDSQADNAEVNEELLGKLKALGISEEEIKTASYRVDVVQNRTQKCDGYYDCVYNYVVVGYKTVHTLNVRTTNLDLGGEIVDTAAGVGENEVLVDYVSFSLQDKTRRELQKSLLKLAGEEAEEKAESIAEGLGTTLGKVVSAGESFYYPQPYYRSYDYAMPMMEGGSVPTSLSAGEVEVSATVSAGYELN